MSTLSVHLWQNSHRFAPIELSAEASVQTVLIISPQKSYLPTLVSTVNIIGELNSRGFELATDQEHIRVAELINQYYLPTPTECWQDQSLILNGFPISAASVDVYEEVAFAREIVIDAAHRVSEYEACGDYEQVRVVQNYAVESISAAARHARHIWMRILDFLARAAISALFDSLFGVPISALLRMVLGPAF